MFRLSVLYCKREQNARYSTDNNGKRIENTQNNAYKICEHPFVPSGQESKSD